MKLSAVLLAGGESRRFGGDKVTVLFEGQPLWRRQLDLLQSLAPAEILISSRTDPLWRPANTRFVPDTVPSRGPLSGLVAAMARMQGTHLLALAVDMPLMTGTLLRQICELIQPGHGVMPYIGTRAEPLAAVYPHESLAHLAASLEIGEFSLQPVAGKLVRAGVLSVVEVSESDRKFYRSINEQSDLAAAYPSEEGATSSLEKRSISRSVTVTEANS